MSFQYKIKVKTDASTTQGGGAGLSFVCHIYDNHGVKNTHTENRYIDRRVTTTDAECFAILFAAKKIHERFQNRKEYLKDYRVTIFSDCEHAVRRVNENHHNEKIDRFINYYKSQFGGIQARWIPRSENQRADALAREIYRKGNEGEL